MAKLQIGTHENRTAFQPGEQLTGAVLWELPQAPEWVELRLVWLTRGKGTEDTCIVRTVRFEDTAAGDTRKFSFQLPDSPYSFSGTLVSLLWALELVTKPGREFERMEITIAPDGREVVLPKSDAVREGDSLFKGLWTPKRAR